MHLVNFLCLAVTTLAEDVDSTSMLAAHMHVKKPVVASKEECNLWEQTGTFAVDSENGNLKAVEQVQHQSDLQELDLIGVVKMVKDKLHDNKNKGCWPADVYDGKPHYGPLFVRLAWHCSGTFRASDNAGGCAGGRIRFDPEAGWADNANLGKARALLADVKAQFGPGLSWGDLFTLAGTVAIHEMGGPTANFCFGRIDDADNKNSLMLNSDCDATTGECGESSGTLVPGLIYVNPQGPGGVPDRVLSAKDIRKAFGRMGMTDYQTVALIGGGHAFGKAHGDPDGVVTSGFEGSWTTRPHEWDNEYFRNLLKFKWRQNKSPNKEKIQWKTKANDGIMMLTADLALTKDKTFKKIAKRFKKRRSELDVAFAEAWARLTTNGNGWQQRRSCVNLDSI